MLAAQLAIRRDWLTADCPNLEGGFMKPKYLLLGLISVFMVGTASAAEISIICTPTGVATFANRIHVRCAQSFSGIVFFAIGSSEPAGSDRGTRAGGTEPIEAAAPTAARYLSLATSALITGRNVRIFYDPADLTGAGIGCLTSDCRLLRGLEIF
jgi:hypothetical protein